MTIVLAKDSVLYCFQTRQRARSASWASARGTSALARVRFAKGKPNLVLYCLWTRQRARSASQAPKVRGTSALVQVRFAEVFTLVPSYKVAPRSISSDWAIVNPKILRNWVGDEASPLQGSLYCPWNIAIRGNWGSSKKLQWHITNTWSVAQTIRPLFWSAWNINHVTI